MTINPASANSPAAAPTPEAAATTAVADPLASKQTFLQLLVAQIKNQNPMSPQDGAEFLSQLAQFTQLEQTVGMREDISAIKQFVLNPPTPAESTQAK